MLVEPEAKGARTHDSRVSTRAPELDADAIGAVLGAAVDACDDPEAAARAAAPWIAACRAYRDACYAADHVWRALLDAIAKARRVLNRAHTAAAAVGA